MRSAFTAVHVAPVSVRSAVRKQKRGSGAGGTASVRVALDAGGSYGAGIAGGAAGTGARG